jgi:hypothetical protein
MDFLASLSAQLRSRCLRNISLLKTRTLHPIQHGSRIPMMYAPGVPGRIGEYR